MIETGPVEVLAIGFHPDARMEGHIFDELGRLEGNGLVRVLDLIFVGIDPVTDELLVLDYQGDALGVLAGALLGFVVEGERVRRRTVLVPPGVDGLGISKDELEALLRGAPAEDAVAVLLIEHLWARDLKRAIGAAGGVPLGEAFLSEATLASIEDELAVVVRLLDDQERSDRDAAPAT